MFSRLFERAADLVQQGPRGLRSKRTLRLECLSAPAEVVFDGAGVPFLYAATERDLLALQGYLHARDRLFQLEMMRRLARGTLSAVVGRQPIKTRDWTVHFKGISTAEFDTFWRAFDLEGAAALSMRQATPKFRGLAGAMAEGVNEYLRRRRWRRPLESRLLRLEVAPWTELDPFLVYKGFAASLALVWQAKVTLAALLAAHPDKADALRALLSLTGRVRETTLPDSGMAQGLSRLASLGRASLEITGYTAAGYGSNAWAIDGQHTRSGKPLLACDPHLPLMAPCIGYLQHLEAPGIKAAGYAGPGIPGLIMGHNADYGFALTHGWIDDCDLFREEIRGGRCRTRDGWVDLVERQVHVDVQGGASFEKTVRRGPRGPLISDILNDLGLDGPGGDSDGASGDLAEAPEGSEAAGRAAISLRWTGMDGGRDLEGYWALCRGRSWGDFRSAAGLFAAPAWNLLYADRDGHIGYQLAGWVPERSWEGGLDLVDGASVTDWRGYVSAEELPSAFDPSDGILASGNQRIVGDTYPHYLSDLFEPPFRAERAREVLARGHHDVASLRALQLDIHSTWADQINQERLQPLLLPATKGGGPRVTHPEARFALMLLRGWDGAMDKEAVAPAVFYAFILAFVRRTLVLRLGETLAVALLERFAMPAFAVEKMLARGEDAWFATETLAGAGQPNDALLEAALADAVRTLRGRFGTRSSTWRWGRMHQRTQHHPLGEIPALGRIFDIGPREASGDGTTVSTGMLRFSDPYEQFGGADARLIMDLGDLDASRWILATGQAGTPLSRHYRDQFELLISGHDRPWPFSRSGIAAGAERRWRCVPKAPRNAGRP
ncbi:MAG: penicillin acylase family protein [Deltaproteobacteria bacterium]|nr:penicillin acylase family protein [Deltaproteobacteria bacterium]